MGAPEGTAAHAYATALRKALDGYLAGGGTQKALGTGTGITASSLSRYLSGDRIAPREKLHAIKAFLEAQSFPCPDGVWDELDELCGKAHLASGAAAVQRDHLKEELTRAWAEHLRFQGIAEEQLQGLQREAGRLSEELELALFRTRSTQAAHTILRKRLTVESRNLLRAQRYNHGIEAELAHQKEQAGLLGQEVGVLRDQNRRLVEEKPAVAAPATQLSHACTPQYVYIPLAPAPAAETVTAAPEVTETATFPQWQTLPQEFPVLGADDLYGTPLHQQDHYDYWNWTFDVRPYGEPDPCGAPDTLLAPTGYQEYAAPHPYGRQDAYGHDAWADAFCDMRDCDERTPAPSDHRQGKETPELASAARSHHTARARRRAGALPAAALIAVLLGSRLLGN
ncbi:helix-turn-helix domain-containing protein [Streptomyces sp. NPDC088762]|uniref:helix-turn-helix domain-containing protein n=1 Tax=Streptomyces sp. NPDC088762 TaxID=3365891 RepID=UPI003813F35C